MSSAIDLVNRLLTRLFDIILLPLASLEPVWGLVFISLISGVILIYFYGLVSNQTAIRNVKRKIHASMLEAVIFRNDLKVSLAAQGRMLGYAFQYLLNAVPALIVLSVPCILILAQLNLRYAFRPLLPGEQSVIKLNLNEPDLLYKVSLAEPANAKITPPLRMEENSGIIWRIDLQENAAAPVDLSLSGLPESFNGNVAVSEPASKIPSESYAKGWMKILYPGDFKLPAGVASLSILYPEREYSLLGMHMHWIVIFFILSLVSGLVASRFLKVEI